ncbi:hypothetical protein [Halopenitus persicus]|uniref:DUF8048 domain-containing protein n=1 Tax=Halopenitus persicus TaxID=1048396 RepID=A0A1H3KYS8_9EURY|nr:hypothetical protein [Halopenitus persicus]SDY57387.1 hypothetical protein SAMN05216564_106223 [Halopenitus persicus]
MTPDRSPWDRSPWNRSPDRSSRGDVDGSGSDDTRGSGSDDARDSDPDATDSDPDATDSDPNATENPAEGLPFDGTVIVQAGALASVPLSRLPAILRPLQRHLADRIDDYRRDHERVLREPDREIFLVDLDHWRALADGLGLGERAREAARRTHETQLERSGSVHDRRAEFESALEIRSAVVIGTDATSSDAASADADGGPAPDATDERGSSASR